MNSQPWHPLALVTLLATVSGVALALAPVSDSEIDAQRQALQKNTHGQGFGPQSPRDIDNTEGSNERVFAPAPAHHRMNLCNIHFHQNAEHKGGEFTTYAGNGDGKGYGSGYRYDGDLTNAERRASDGAICASKHGALAPGDTIEVHYVHTSADVVPGPTLGACLDDALKNPQLRVETQVFVLVNDSGAANFGTLTTVGKRDGYQQALNLPDGDGAVEYAGSTTGPGYNEAGSPFQVTWRVRPDVIKVDAGSVGNWCQDNMFDEQGAHGVRNLVVNPALLSPID